MEPLRMNFKFTEPGRNEAVLNTTMERAIEIARDRAAMHRSEVKLSVETKPGKFTHLGLYFYSPTLDQTGREVAAVPVTPKHIIEL